MTDAERKALEDELYTLKRTASLSNKEAMARIRELEALLGIERKVVRKKTWLSNDARKYARDLL